MPFLIPFLVSSLVGGFASSIIQGIIKTMISVGIGYVIYKGLDVLFQSIMQQVSTYFGASGITGILAMLKLDKCLNVLASAVAVKYSLKATANGLKRMMIK